MMLLDTDRDPFLQVHDDTPEAARLRLHGVRIIRLDPDPAVHLEGGSTWIALTGRGPVRAWLETGEPTVPMAIAQPRNDIPLWMLRWELQLHERARYNIQGPWRKLARDVGSMLFLWCVILPCLIAHALWHGEGPRVMPRTEPQKLLRARGVR